MQEAVVPRHLHLVAVLAQQAHYALLVELVTNSKHRQPLLEEQGHRQVHLLEQDMLAHIPLAGN